MNICKSRGKVGVCHKLRPPADPTSIFLSIFGNYIDQPIYNFFSNFGGLVFTHLVQCLPQDNLIYKISTLETAR